MHDDEDKILKDALVLKRTVREPLFVIISDEPNTTTQRRVIHIVGRIWAAISFYNPHESSLQQSITERRNRLCVWDIGPIHFPLTFLLSRVVRRASSQSDGSPSSRFSLQMGRRRLKLPGPY